MNQEYATFLASKSLRATERGLTKIPELASHLFPFQRLCIENHLRVGAAGCFLDTGLGKTEVQLEFCQKAIEATNGRAIIWTPLAVAGQTKRRADKWGYEARVIREQSDISRGINICNYERHEKIDPSAFAIVSCDEASILKSFTGKTTRAMIDNFEGHRFKLVATATPAPNDHMELGQYCEFLDIMPSNEMLARWFISDQTEMGRYRLKGHAVNSFWDWMASWARMVEKPSDITANLQDDAAFRLPPFEIIRHRATETKIDRTENDLFGMPMLSATTIHDIKRQTAAARADVCAEIVSANVSEPYLIWCDTNYEADALKAVLPHAIEVRGSMSIDEKEDLLAAFETGRYALIAKPSMCGFGLDWSHCARMIFVGRSFSYETWYQAVRRCWRYGQKRKLIVHLVVAEGEDEIGRVIDRKSADHGKMKLAMQDSMLRALGRKSEVKIAYDPQYVTEAAPWLKSFV